MHFLQKFFGDGKPGTGTDDRIDTAMWAHGGHQMLLVHVRNILRMFFGNPFFYFPGSEDVQAVKATARFILGKLLSIKSTKIMGSNVIRDLFFYHCCPPVFTLIASSGTCAH
jgi:hypothetical protein